MDVYPGLGQRGVHRGAEITSQTFRQSKEQSGLKKRKEKNLHVDCKEPEQLGK